MGDEAVCGQALFIMIASVLYYEVSSTGLNIFRPNVKKGPLGLLYKSNTLEQNIKVNSVAYMPASKFQGPKVCFYFFTG